jgi:hypothetical protein
MANDDLEKRWKAFSPQQRDLAMSHMSAEQKLKLAQMLGYKQASAPVHELGPAPPVTTGSQWWGQALDDLRSGGSRTGIGRTLGMLQGRGDKGYSGLQSGASPEQAEFMGSVPLGIARATKGVAETKEGSIGTGAKDVIAGLGQASTIPAAIEAGPAMNLARDVIPSKTVASMIFKDVSAATGKVPVSFNNSLNEIMRAEQLADAGATMPKAIGNLMKRIRNIASGAPGKAFDYDEARDFYSNITRLSAEEGSKMNPVMRGQIAKVAQAFNRDIAEAAARVGKEADYLYAMGQYAKAMKLRRGIAWTAKYLAAPAAAGVAGKMGYDAILKNLKESAR